MLKFVFLLTMWQAEHVETYVMDENLSGAECIAEMDNYLQTTPDFAFGTPSCEIDLGH